MLTTGTGSGKSLACFIPIIDRVLRRQAAGGGDHRGGEGLDQAGGAGASVQAGAGAGDRRRDGHTFLAAQGKSVGTSLQEAGMHGDARDILTAAAKAGCEVVLPVDAMTAGALKVDAATRTVAIRPGAG